MGFFDKARNAYKQNQTKRAATLTNAQYMGGYADKQKATGNLSFYDDQIEFKVALNARASFTIPTREITDIAIEGKDEVSRRVTVTRMAAFGLFAFALQKKQENKDAFVALTHTNGQEVIFHIKGMSPMELRARFSDVLARIKQHDSAN